MVVLAAGMPATAGAVDYIKDVMLIGGSSDKVSTLKTTLTGEGWTVIDVDLNRGCGSGSDYIYLLYKSESNADNLNLGYITDFYISDSEEALDAILYNGLTYHLVPFEGGSDFVSSKGDLNRGAGGAYIHLYFTKEAFHDQRTVSGIEIKTGEDNAAGALGVNGNTTTGYDLNTEAHAGGRLVQRRDITGNTTTEGPISVVLSTATPEPFFVALRNENTTEAEALNFKVVGSDGVTYLGSKTIPADYKSNGHFVSIKNATLTDRMKMETKSTKVSTAL